MTAHPEDQRLRLAVVGWGAIAHAAAGLLATEPVDIVAVGGRSGSARPDDLPAGAAFLADPSELAACRPDVVVEAAGVTAVAPWGRASLEAGVDVIVSSAAAFADSDLLESLLTVAARHGARLQVQPGALGGVDALASARLMGVDQVQHTIIKPPRAWYGTPAEELCDLAALTEPQAFFRGTASEAARRFPKNANVAMTTALAGVGPEQTRIVLVADPAARVNRHEIEASGAFGELSVAISNNPLEENPKTSAMTALNLVRAIKHRIGPLVI